MNSYSIHIPNVWYDKYTVNLKPCYESSDLDTRGWFEATKIPHYMQVEVEKKGTTIKGPPSTRRDKPSLCHAQTSLERGPQVVCHDISGTKQHCWLEASPLTG